MAEKSLSCLLSAMFVLRYPSPLFNHLSPLRQPFLTTLLLAFCLFSQAFAAEVLLPLDLDLPQAITLAKKNNPLVELGRLEVELSREKAVEIAGKFLSPQWRIDSTTGLITGAEGDVTDPPENREDDDDLGPFFKIDLKVVQPLYTFGKYTSASEAARFNVEMKEAMLQQGFNELAFSVCKAFLAMTAGRQGREVGEKLSEQYQRLIGRIEKLLASNDPEISDSHLLETRSMFFEITRQSTLGGMEEDQAALLLLGLLNLEPGTRLLAASPPSPHFNDSDTLLLGFLAHGQSHSWPLRILDSGLKALQHKTELEANMQFPDLFLAAGAGYARAPNRDKQDNPFIEDDYNYEKIGAVLGLKWDFNYQTNSALQKQAIIDCLKLAEQRKLALLRQDGEIRKAYMTALRHSRLQQAADESLRAARQWLRLESDNIDLGIGDVKRLVSAYKQYFLLQADEIDNRYKYHLSLAQLAKTLGDMQLYLQWVENGQVQL